MAHISNFPQSLLDIHHYWHDSNAHPGVSGSRINKFSPEFAYCLLCKHTISRYLLLAGPTIVDYLLEIIASQLKDRHHNS